MKIKPVYQWLLIFGCTLVCVLHFVRLARPFGEGHDPDFDTIIREWSDNARTNAPIETVEQFIVREVRPLVEQELPNPFVEGGSEAGRPWAEEGRLLYARLIRVIAGESPSIWAYDGHVEAYGLYEKGCRDPLVSIFAALDRSSDYGKRKCYEMLDEAEKTVSEKEDSLLGTLVAYYRFALHARTPRNHEVVAKRFSAWIRKRGFGSERERALWHLAENFELSRIGIFDGLEQFRWAATMAEAIETMEEGRSAGGPGVKVSTSGGISLGCKATAAWASLDEADTIVSGRPETWARYVWVEGESRCSQAERLDALFKRLTAMRLDDPFGLRLYVWHRLIPRWHCCSGYGDLLRFADACSATARHDTFLPFFAAALQCYYVLDAELDPREYFRSHPEIVDRSLDACMRQLTNENACAHARLTAPYVGSYIAYHAGRYDQTNLFAAVVGNHVRHYWFNNLFPAPEDVSALNALGGRHAAECRGMQQAYDEGRYDDVLSLVKAARPWFCTPSQTDEELSFVGKLKVNAQVKRAFARGEKVFAEAPPYFPGWRICDWWRAGDGVWDTYPNSFQWESALRWRAELPVAHEVEFSLAPKPKTDGRHVAVVSRFQHERLHHLPLNRVPFVTLVWERDRTGLVVKNDYYQMFNVNPSSLQWIAAAGPSLARKIRLSCDGERLSVFVDGELVWNSVERGVALGKVKPVGFLRFHGDNVRISDVFVTPL